MVNIEAEIKSIIQSKLQNAKIVNASNEKQQVNFDLVGDIIKVSEGDKLEIIVDKKKPENIDVYDFCGHGYLVKPEKESKITILSLWGILFEFDPPIGLEENTKYYLCLRKI
jgi:DNA-directed RNA polymerase subunit G